METITTEKQKTTNDQTTDQKKSERLILTGMFNDRDNAERAYSTLIEHGYTKNEINLIMSENTRKKNFTDKSSDLGNKAQEGAGTGAILGGTIGAAVGIIAAIGTSVIIPGLGILVAGPILTGLAGAGAGSIAGGLIGALVGAGIPEESAKRYEAGVRDGRIVLWIHPRNEEDAKFFETNWRTNKAEEIYRS